MYIESFVNNGRPYLRIVQSVRIATPDGRKIPQKQVVYNIGPLDRFDDGEPDYVNQIYTLLNAQLELNENEDYLRNDWLALQKSFGVDLDCVLTEKNTFDKRLKGIKLRSMKKAK